MVASLTYSILLELVVGFGKGETTQEILNESFSLILRKLNCRIVVLARLNDYNEVTLDYSLPVAFSDVETLKRLFPTKEELNDNQPYFSYSSEHIHFYSWEVSGFGRLIIGRNNILDHSFACDFAMIVGQLGRNLQRVQEFDMRRHAEDVAMQHVQMQEILINISSTYINAKIEDVPFVINHSLKEMTEFVRADRGYIFDYDLDARDCSNTFEYCAEGIEPEIDNLQNIPIDAINDWIVSHSKGEAFYVPNVQELPVDDDPYSLRNILEPQGIKSLITFPMHDGDTLLGFVGFDSVKEYHNYTEKEKNLLLVFAMMLVNIHKRQHADRALRDSRDRYFSLVSNIPGVTYRCKPDEHFSILFVSQSIVDLTGYSATEFSAIGNFSAIIHPEDIGYVQREVLSADKKWEIEYRIINKNGDIRWVVDKGVVTTLSDVEDVYLDGFIQDIHESKMSAVASREESLFRNLLADISGKFIQTGVEEYEASITYTLEKIADHYMATRSAVFVLCSDQKVVKRSFDYQRSGTVEPSYSENRFIDISLPNLIEYFQKDDSLLITRHVPISELLVEELKSLECRNLAEAYLVAYRLDNNQIGLIALMSDEPFLNQRIDVAENLRRILVVLSDVYSRYRLESRMIEAKVSAERANNAKSSFLANMSHEIRTPLNSIIGFSELMAEKTNDPESSRYLRNVLNSAQGLLQLINDILDMAKVDAGKISIAHTVGDIRQTAQNVINLFQPQAQKKNIKLHVTISERVPPNVLFDELRIKQILLNLVGNAVKFTKVGHVKLCVDFQYTSLKSETGNIILEVSDTGIGIPPQQVESIFEAFTQLQSEELNDVHVEGTGLGLTITKRLVGLMYGQISVESTVNRGTKFTVVIPDIQKVSHFVVSERESKVVKSSFNKQRILVVDDIATNLSLVEAFLKKTNLILNKAANGKQALKLAESFRPDLILLDIRLPDLNGVEVARQIRAASNIQHVKIVSFSASLNVIDNNDRDLFDAHVAKPVRKSELLNVLKNVLTVKQPTLEVVVQEAVSSESISKGMLSASQRNQLKEQFKSVVQELLEVSDLDKMEEFVDQLARFNSKVKSSEILSLCDDLSKALESLDIDSFNSGLKKMETFFPRS